MSTPSSAFTRLWRAVGLHRWLRRRQDRWAGGVTSEDEALRLAADQAHDREDWEEVERIGRQLAERQHRVVRLWGQLFLASAAIGKRAFEELEVRLRDCTALAEQFYEVIGRTHPSSVETARFLGHARTCFRDLKLVEETIVASEEGRVEDERAGLIAALESGAPELELWGLQGLAMMAASRDDLGETPRVFEELEARAHELVLDGEPEADSVSSWLHRCKAHFARRRRQFDEARRHCERALKLAPSNDLRMDRCIHLKHSGRLDEAIETLEALLAEGASDDIALLRQVLVGYLYLAGRHGEAASLHRRIGGQDRVRLESNEAWIAACRGDRDACLETMSRSPTGESGARHLPFYRMDVEFDRYRDDPRFPEQARRD